MQSRRESFGKTSGMKFSNHRGPNWLTLIRRILRTKLLPVVAISISTVACTFSQASETTLVLWMMPNEQPPAEVARVRDVLPYKVLRKQIEDFKQDWGEGSPVQVLNVTQPALEDQLPTQDRYHLVQFWSTIRFQTELLEQLKVFSKQENVRIQVRFLDWQKAFRQIQQALQNEAVEAERPDLVQVGTTWYTYFRANRLVHDFDSDDVTDPIVPFTIDTRLVWYYRRMPTIGPSSATAREKSNELDLSEATSWQQLFKELDEFAGNEPSDFQPLCIPILPNTNLLHDYAPLVWDGGGRLMSESGKYLSCSRDRALAAPVALAKYATRQRKGGTVDYDLVAFPDASHPETRALFANQHYRVCVEPPSFIQELYRVFRKQLKDSSRTGSAAESDLDDRTWSLLAKHIDVAPIPTFKGGSGLMTTNKNHSDAHCVYRLARELATGSYAAKLASQGELLSQLEKSSYGVDELFASLKVPEDMQAEFRQDVLGAISVGRSHTESEHWPEYMESPELLEAVLEMWKTIARGASQSELRLAAREIEATYNNEVHLGTRVFRFFTRPETILIAAFVGLITFGVYRRRMTRDREQKALYRHFAIAHGHSASSQIGARIEDLAARVDITDESVEEYRSALDDLVEATRGYGECVHDYLTKFRAVTNSLLTDRLHKAANSELRELVRLSSQMATLRYRVHYDKSKTIELESAGTPQVRLRSPAALVIATEEWFFNSLRNQTSDRVQAETMVERTGDIVVLRVGVPAGSEEDGQRIQRVFNEPVGEVRIRESGNGLRIIKGMLWNAYHIAPKFERTREQFVLVVRFSRKSLEEVRDGSQE